VRRIGRRRAQSPLDHGSNLIVVDRARAAGAGLVKQAIAAILQKSAAPLANGVFVEAKFDGDRLAWQTLLCRDSSYLRTCKYVVIVLPGRYLNGAARSCLSR
jgi:hypothetical protein